jgi:hypothetical protein
LRGREPQTVNVCGPGRHDPEFVDTLDPDAEFPN